MSSTLLDVDAVRRRFSSLQGGFVFLDACSASRSSPAGTFPRPHGSSRSRPATSTSCAPPPCTANGGAEAAATVLATTGLALPLLPLALFLGSSF